MHEASTLIVMESGRHQGLKIEGLIGILFCT